MLGNLPTVTQLVGPEPAPREEAVVEVLLASSWREEGGGAGAPWTSPATSPFRLCKGLPRGGQGHQHRGQGTENVGVWHSYKRPFRPCSCACS